MTAVRQDRLDRMKLLASRLQRNEPSHPVIEYGQRQEAESVRAAESIDLWFSFWLMAQFLMLLTLTFLGVQRWRGGINLLETGIEDLWLVSLLGVEWVLVLIAAATCSYHAVHNKAIVRRRMLLLGLVPWAVMAAETLFELFWMI